MNTSNAFQPRELHSRLLYPFFFRHTNLDQVVGKLIQISLPTRHGETSLWKLVDTPQEFYRQEMLNTIRDFLFPSGDEKNRSSSNCRYLQIAEPWLNTWFRKEIVVREPDGNRFLAKLIPRQGIELFLSPYGVGLFSITLMTETSQWETEGLTVDNLKRFNYRLAQLSRRQTIPVLFIPHPKDQQAAGAEINSNIPPPPAKDAAFVERLGKLGGEFTLRELVDYLLSPVTQSYMLKEVQSLFSVYTVVRFGRDVDFAKASVRERLGPLLASLAQVEETTHAGTVPGENLDIFNHVLNTRHWAGVGFLGAAHLVADQDPPHPFDEQRVQTVRDKYFIAYLVAFLQRLILHCSIGRAAAIVHAASRQTKVVPSEEQDVQFHQLHSELLDFTVTGYCTEVSGREALNRFYRMAQAGLGVERAWQTVTQAIHDHYADKLIRNVSHNVETVSHVQRKVEWLEVFFASFYAAEMAHLLSGEFFTHGFTVASVAFWALFALSLALWGLKPWKTGRQPDEKKINQWHIIVILLLVIVLVWLGLGWAFGRDREHGQDWSPAAHVPAPKHPPRDEQGLPANGPASDSGDGGNTPLK